MSRERALTKLHIELDPIALRSWIAVAIDRSDGFVRACSGGRELWPNVVVENPGNGHVHSLWKLSSPVLMTDAGHTHPKRYAAHIASGLNLLTDADRAYNQTLIKNPEHSDWPSHWIHDRSYSLGELHKGLDTLGALPDLREAPVPQADNLFGRQHTLFENLRKWAYRECRYYLEDKNAEGFALAVGLRAHKMNADYVDNGTFHSLLPYREVEHTARSISRWIIRNPDFWKSRDEYNAVLSRMQSARGKKSAAVRKRRGYNSPARDALIGFMEDE